MTEYEKFIERKLQSKSVGGFDPTWMPDVAFDFQRYLIEWACRLGRAAIFADCGLGKTLMQLAWAENVVRKTNRPVLIGTPIAVASQTVAEGEKFGIECQHSRDGKNLRSKIVVTNYERLHYFDPEDFGGMVCDESQAIKSFDAKRTETVIEFMRNMQYRLLCTATAAPNDYFELGTSSEALGYLGFRDMITWFFKQETSKDRLGWGRTKYRFRGHAEQPFWQWVCSWARSLRRPSDCGFSDDGFNLPPLVEKEIVVATAKPRPGLLFTIPARDMREERAERHHSIRERCERACEIVNAHSGPSVLWCELNPEGDLLQKMLAGSVQIKGAMRDDEKEEAFDAFSRGQIRHLVTKPKIGAWGLNWQHCCNTTIFPSHSFEQYYQLLRRFYRYGQKNTVTASLILSEGETGIVDNLKRKQNQAVEMFGSIVRHMNDALHLASIDKFPEKEDVPGWLSGNRGAAEKNGHPLVAVG